MSTNYESQGFAENEALSLLLVRAVEGAATAISTANRVGEASAKAASTIDESVSLLIRVMPKIKLFLYYTGLIQFLFFSSVINYGILYIWMMPSSYAREPIYFDYNYKGIEKMTLSDSCHENSGSIAAPTAVIDLFAGHSQWNPIVDEVAPTVSESRILRPDIRYFFDVGLTLYESPSNVDVGMFMVEVELYGRNWTHLASSGRAAMLPYRSAMVSYIYNTFMILPLLIGAIPEARQVILKVFDNFIELDADPLSYIVVRIVVPSLARNVQILSAELRIGKELTLVQFIMKEWFYSCACTGIFCIMILEGLLVYFFQIWFRRKRNQWALARAKRLREAERRRQARIRRHCKDNPNNVREIENINNTEPAMEDECDIYFSDSKDWEETVESELGDTDLTEGISTYQNQLNVQTLSSNKQHEEANDVKCEDVEIR